jgi:outer membrane murein-binding lipoprotein Lpp
MSESTYVWKIVLIAFVCVSTLIAGSCTIATIHSNQTSINKAQIESSQLSKDAAQARYLEAKALADRAMFESMHTATK